MHIPNAKMENTKNVMFKIYFVIIFRILVIKIEYLMLTTLYMSY